MGGCSRSISYAETGYDTVLLHGTLDVTIIKADHLPITAWTKITSIFKKYVCCNMLPELVGSCDPYCCMDVGTTRRLRTTFMKNVTHPVWNEHFEVDVADEAKDILFSVKVGVSKAFRRSATCRRAAHGVFGVVQTGW
jgi:hypothetical protein